jgi:hypothetical protein
MPRVRFTAPFQYHVRHNVTISYKAGHEYLVKQECAAQAVKAGKAQAVKRRKESPDAVR